MKTETKVDIADYLELYEFKKAYDEGRKVCVKSRHTDRMFWIPVEEMKEEMYAFIQEYENKSENWESEEAVQGYIHKLSQDIEDYKSEKDQKDEYIYTLEWEAIKKVESDESKISSLKFQVKMLWVSLGVAILSLAISLIG